MVERVAAIPAGTVAKSHQAGGAKAQAGTASACRGVENRLAPAIFNATSVATLITDIGLANTNGASANTINLTGSGPYTLTSVNNSTDGPNGLPVISSTVVSTLTINGNGNTIQRDPLGASLRLRFFDIAPNGSLVLKNIALMNGLEEGSGSSAEGGAIFNNGKLTLAGGVQLVNNTAGGTGVTSSGAGNNAAGGGIYCTGGSVLKLTGSNLFESCIASADRGNSGKMGGSAFGGAIFDNTATSSSLSSTAGTVVASCAAYGGSGGAGVFSGAGGSGGSASGGGLFVNGASSIAKAALAGFTFEFDKAVGGRGGKGGNGAIVAGFGGAGGSANGGALAASGGTVTDSSFIVVDSCEADGGRGGHGGGARFAGSGGTGGNASGGGIATSGTILTLSASPTLVSNRAVGGGGGSGGSGSNAARGGNSGIGMGGGLYATATGTTTVTLHGALLASNTTQDALPGPGGQGAAGRGGGSGSFGGGFGGGLYLSQNAKLTSDTILSNSAGGGSFSFSPGGFTLRAAGSATNGGAGGAGGTGGGGGLYVAGATVTVTSCVIENNTAAGGEGANTRNPSAGTPGVGGAARGGGVDIEGGIVTISSSQIEFNLAYGGGAGFRFGTAGSLLPGGAAGGAAAGVGLYVGGGTVHLKLDVIQSNAAFGGIDTDTGHPAASSGGGIYLVTGMRADARLVYVGQPGGQPRRES